MSASMEQMRNYLIKTYPGDRWRLKVQQMPTNQVVAIYHNLKSRKPKRKLTLDKRTNNGVQMTIFDYINEKGEFSYEQVK